MYLTRTTCRLCGGNLKTVIDLGDIYVSTFLADDDKPAQKAPIELTVCESCDLAQLRHTVDQDVMYSDYWYQSGLNDSMIKALGDVVTEVKKRVVLEPDDIVVDIGGNDGTLLSLYPEGLYRICVEPSNLADLAAGKCEVIINNYFSARRLHEWMLGRKAKVITAIAMFYDLEDPHTFVQDLKDSLIDDGLIVIQMMDLISMWKCNDFPNLCHEHLEYYSLKVLTDLMYDHGLQVFDVQYNGVNGGSLRVYIRHLKMNDNGDHLPYNTVYEALMDEEEYFNQFEDPYITFRHNIEEVKDKVLRFIREHRQEGETFAVLGASTKGNTILQYFGLTSEHLDHAAEINPDKFGRRMVGSNIPIIPQTESLWRNPDYYLVLPWGFIDNFIHKFRQYLKDDGCFLVPLPNPYIVYSDEEFLWEVKEEIK